MLTKLRSPAGALCDLIEKYEGTPPNHPTRLVLARMIRELACEITRPTVDRYRPAATQ